MKRSRRLKTAYPEAARSGTWLGHGPIVSTVRTGTTECQLCLKVLEDRFSLSLVMEFALLSYYVLHSVSGTVRALGTQPLPSGGAFVGAGWTQSQTALLYGVVVKNSWGATVF